MVLPPDWLGYLAYTDPVYRHWGEGGTEDWYRDYPPGHLPTGLPGFETLQSGFWVKASWALRRFTIGYGSGRLYTVLLARFRVASFVYLHFHNPGGRKARILYLLVGATAYLWKSCYFQRSSYPGAEAW